jgi:hypothetical protein
MSKSWITVLSIAMIVSTVAFASPAKAGRLYWSKNFGDVVPGLDTTLSTVRTDGMGLFELYERDDVLIGQVAIDSASRSLYWVEDNFSGFKLVRGDANSCLEVDVEGYLQRIALDVIGEKVYWTEFTQHSGEGRILRANLDLSSVEVVLEGATGAREIDIDPIGGRIYWFNQVDNTIARSNLDGSNVEVQFQVQLLRGMQVDPIGQKIYWVDWNPGGFRRADLDGANVEELAPQVKTPFVIDLGTGTVYWQAEYAVGPYWVGTIKRADLDGSNEAIVRHGDDVASTYLAFDPADEPISLSCGLPVPAVGLGGTGLLVLLLLGFSARAVMRS